MQGQSSYDDGWDWPWLLYLGIKQLKLSEETFWAMSPRKFYALLECELTVRDHKKNDESIENGYIDNIPGW